MHGSPTRQNPDSAKCRWRPVRQAGVLALGLLAAACGGDLFGRSDRPSAPGVTRSSPSLGDRISGLFGNQSAQSEAQAPTSPGILPEDFDCPTVSIRTGASTFAVSVPGADPSAMTLRYQATFVQTARECKLAANILTIRVGVEGRIVLGPAGGPGQLELPMRYAVVREGPEPKTIVTKLRWITVAIPADAPNVPFTHVEEELSFPAPRQRELDAYVVYVGFDRAAAKEPERKRPIKPPPRPPKRGT